MGWTTLAKNNNRNVSAERMERKSMSDVISELFDYESCERAFVAAGEVKQRARLHVVHKEAHSALESREHVLRVEAAGRHMLITLFRRSVHALLVWEEESVARIELHSDESGARAVLRRLHELQWLQGAAHAPLFAEEATSRRLIAKARHGVELEWQLTLLQLREEVLREAVVHENGRRCGVLGTAWVATLHLDTIADEEERERGALSSDALASLRALALSMLEWLAHAKEDFHDAQSVVRRSEESARQRIVVAWGEVTAALRLDELIQRHLCAVVVLCAREMTLREQRRKVFRTARARLQLAEVESHWRCRLQNDEAEVARAHHAWHGSWIARYSASRAVDELETAGRTGLCAEESSVRWSARFAELQQRQDVLRVLLVTAPWEQVMNRLGRRELVERNRLRLVLEQEPKARRSVLNLERMWWLKCITSKSAMQWRVTRIEHTQADGRRMVEKEQLEARDSLERFYLYSTSSFADEQLIKFKRVMYQRNRQDRRRLAEHEEVPRQRIHRLECEGRMQLEQRRFFGVEAFERRRQVELVEADERAYLKKRIEGRVTAMVTTSVVVFAEPIQRVVLEEWQGRQFHVLRQAWWFTAHMLRLIWNTCFTEMWESRVFYLREEARSRLLLVEHARRSILYRQLMTAYIAVCSQALLEQWLGFHSVGATHVASDERLGRCLCLESYQRARLRRLEACERASSTEHLHRTSLLKWEARDRFRLKEALARSLVVAQNMPARMHMMTHLVAPQEHLERELVAMQQAETWRVLWREAERGAFVSGALTRLRTTGRDEGEERIHIEVRHCRAIVSHDEAQARSLLPEAHVRLRIQLHEAVARSVLEGWFVELVIEPRGRAECEQGERSCRLAVLAEIRVVQVYIEFHCLELAARHEVERQEQEERELHHLSRQVDRSLKRHGSRRRSLDEIVSAARVLFPSNATEDSEMTSGSQAQSSVARTRRRTSSSGSGGGGVGSFLTGDESCRQQHVPSVSGRRGSNHGSPTTNQAAERNVDQAVPSMGWRALPEESGAQAQQQDAEDANRHLGTDAQKNANELTPHFFLLRCALDEPFASDIDDSEFLARTRIQQHEDLLYEQLCAYARDDLPSTDWGLPTPPPPSGGSRGSLLGAAFQRRFLVVAPPPPTNSTMAGALAPSLSSIAAPVAAATTPTRRPQHWAASTQKALTPVAPTQQLLSPERRAFSARRPVNTLPPQALLL